MKTIEPSHKKIMKYLDCYYSKWHEGQCTCFKEAIEDTNNALREAFGD